MSTNGFDIVSATIAQTSERLRRRELSPVEVTMATLDRIEALQSRLGCFTTLVAEHALQRAREAEQEIMHGRYRGPMHGIPYTLKDVVATKGIRTTFGDPKGVDYRPPESATLHTLLDEAGGILLGKVVSEIGRHPTGPVGCRNAWDTRRSPGTSSSGSASAVAASLGFASIGTDTGGSVRHPASNSGLVGMKASFGRISRFGVWASSWTSDQAGPLTRTVEDNALLLELLGVHDPKDPVSLNVPREAYRAGMRDGIAGVRIGVPVDDWIWKEWLGEEEEAVVRNALDVLASLGACLMDVELPRTAQGRAVLHVLTASEAQVYLEDNYTPAQIADWPEWHPRLTQGRSQSFADYLHAQQQRALICQEVATVLRHVDLIAMPTGSTFGDDWDADTVVIRGRVAPARSRAVYRNAMASLTGHPEISVPCGFGLNDTMPIGLMLHGGALQEALLYRVAHAYEQATPWHKRHPQL